MSVRATCHGHFAPLDEWSSTCTWQNPSVSTAFGTGVRVRLLCPQTVVRYDFSWPLQVLSKFAMSLSSVHPQDGLLNSQRCSDHNNDLAEGVYRVPRLRDTHREGGNETSDLFTTMIWVLAPCRFADRYQSFGETRCLHLRGWRWETVSSECGNCMCPWNFGIYLRIHKASTYRTTSPLLPPWDPQISQQSLAQETEPTPPTLSWIYAPKQLVSRVNEWVSLQSCLAQAAVNTVS
jgi:hypothetical protein